MLFPYTQTPDGKEEPDKTTDGGAAGKDKKITALQKSLEARENEIIKLLKLLEFKDGVFLRRTALRQEVKKRQQEETTLTPNDMKHPGNKTDGGSAEDKEEMKRKIAALEQLLELKDRVIQKQKGIIQDMKESQRKYEEVDIKVTCEAHTEKHNNIKLTGNISDGGAAEMKFQIAVLERSLEEKDHQNRTLIAIIQAMKERQGSEIICIERNEEIGKYALLRKIRQLREEITSLK